MLTARHNIQGSRLESNVFIIQKEASLNRHGVYCLHASLAYDVPDRVSAAVLQSQGMITILLSIIYSLVQ